MRKGLGSRNTTDKDPDHGERDTEAEQGERVIIKGHNGTLKVMSIMFTMLIEVIVSQVDVS